MAPEIKALKSGSSSQRDHLNHQAIEDYLKSIYTLAQEESPVSTTRLAEARGVKPASVTGMLQRLARLNLVNYAKHQGVTLTPAGKQVALEVIRHHRLIELYLIEALGFTWDEVHEQADVLEHVISEKLEERIAAALDNPKFDPHGDPIPSKSGEVVRRPTELLIDQPAGTTVKIARIRDNDNSELLRYLGELGMMPGALCTILEIAPFDGPLTLEIDGRRTIVGFNVATAVHVTPVADT